MRRAESRTSLSYISIESMKDSLSSMNKIPELPMVVSRLVPPVILLFRIIEFVTFARRDPFIVARCAPLVT